MPSNYDRLMLVTYLSTLCSSVAATRASPVREVVMEWLDDYGHCIGIEIAESSRAPRRRSFGPRVRTVSKAVSAAVWDGVNEALAARRSALRGARPNVFEKNLEAVCLELGLEEADIAIARLIASNRLVREFEHLTDSMLEAYKAGGVVDLIAGLLGVRTNEIARRLRTSSALIRSGLIAPSTNHRGIKGLWEMPYRILNALLPPNHGTDGFRRSVFGVPCRTALHWADFVHLGADRDSVVKVLEGAAAEGTKGINILIYGPPGTGKTEFCKAVAARMGAKLFAIGEADDEGDEPDRSDRVAAFKLAHSLLSDNSGTLLLFDEMEDLLGELEEQSGRVRRRMEGSRVFANRLLEGNPVPAFWTCNNIGLFDPALVRRMTMAIEMRVPSPMVRERVWRRLLTREGVRMPDREVVRLAREFEASPAVAANAVRAARLAGGDVDTVRSMVHGIRKAMNGGRELPPPTVPGQFYDPTLANADHDLVALAEQVAAAPDRRISFCMFGAPGTGKSAWARHLAARLGMEVLHKRASDLLSSWVGGSEANIAQAFAEARDRGALLILDEADSLLADRRGAHQSWEVSQVNEMLTWMESHPLPFVCTTNLMEKLDQASLRRFTFKVRFDYMRPDQTAVAFQQFFGSEPPDGLRMLKALTPADFSLTARKAGVIGATGDPSRLLVLLEAECRAKPEAPRPIGFM